MTLKAYDISLLINGEYKYLTLDDTIPSVNDWKSAVETSMMLVKMDDSDAIVDLLDVKEHTPNEFIGIKYAYPVPLVIQ
ncbi:MAG: hypothetical protein CBC83_04640 [Flavobacteriales bacterium TMED123]|nr:hypothetical protein [Candidatus Neomarinimicrobiota bacterium]OUV73929.1 MAG: hypothetical protein CBC83_04640 [Flavobacteriales bacterium TMED123]|tara:strand:- start:2195 stop:2431 length:237 start_codon:yes stop_codon:yes gene_type:complete